MAGNPPKKRRPGPQAAYRRSGFGGVWRWAKGHGIKRWLQARNWARRKAHAAKDPEGFRKARKAYDRKYNHLKAKRHHETHAHGHIVTFDGKPCAKWIANILQAARDSGIWNGQLLSGVRTVAESIALCEAMCGAPACPGRCAGANTNHTCPPSHECSYPEGAADCTDPAGLEAFCRSHNKPLKGDGVVLPSDINHFSHAGN